MRLLTLKLDQHTPLLHFQGEQHLATLRASEVKPRLDKFIIKNEFNDEFESCKTFLIGYNSQKPDELSEKFKSGYRALNYKMRIITNDSRKPIDPDKNNAPMFFGNIGNKNASEKSLVMRENNIIEIRIPLTCSALYEIIVKHIGNMFMCTNFGTRSSKGYGSFTINDTNIHSLQPKLYFDSYKVSYSEVMREIEWIHKTLRSGINDCFGRNNGRNILYFKSLMFAYAKSKGKQWDKRTIKQAFLNRQEISEQANRYNDDITSYNGNQPHYDFRDCLGLSTDESWKSYRMTIKKISQDIDRLPSPFVFKPVKYRDFWRIYIIYNELPDEFKAATISINSNKNSEAIRLPIDPEFSIKSYMDFVFRRDESGHYAVNIEDLFSKQTNNKYKKNRIIKIFKELRNNYNK